MIRTASFILLSLAVGGISFAQDAPPAEAPATAPATRPAVPAAAQPAYQGLAVTTHDAAGLRYRAVAGTLPMNDDDGKLRGEMFFTYYERLGADGKALHDETGQKRPITYLFNGGPGAASVWLHLGTVGPYRVPLGDNGQPSRPPYQVVPNDATWLDETDLCFIDPIGTGFSRPAGDAKPEEARRTFYGVAQDAQWVAEFIRLHCTRFGRWDDPKFLAGESYGTTRAAVLSNYLHNRFGLDVNGVILVSTVLDFATISPADNNPLPYVLYLPTYTNVAAFHKKLDGDPEQARKEAEAFAFDEYLPALMKGANLSKSDKQAVAEKYARLTGLPPEYVLRSDLRVAPSRFEKELLSDDRQLVGRMDGRITGYDTDPLGDTPNTDPSLDEYVGVYTGAFNDYVRNNLEYKSDLPYEALSGRVGPWQPAAETQRSYSGGYLNVADDLQDALNGVPGLRLMVAAGRYDLATPYFAADYTLDHMTLSPEARSRVTQTYYGGGHMLYHVAGERGKLHADVSQFIEAATGPTTRKAD